ncbi:MAG TPA: flavoprotein [Ktedonosporobacter sp.]|jgi:phosphopantothenoylcysteine synthetase/decarboxylase|nr:flavoprotein [Ktedonosporobacter sp.]
MIEEKLCEKLLVGVTSSINAISIHIYLQHLRAGFAQHIKVIMTQNAAQIVSPKVVEFFADDRVFMDYWDQSPSVDRLPHIQLTQWADLFLIFPATADILGKAANGIANDLLSTSILSYTGPIVFVPAMNLSMWKSKALQRNIQALEKDGHYIVPPESPTFDVGSCQQDALVSRPEDVLRHLKQVRIKFLREARMANIKGADVS